MMEKQCGDCNVVKSTIEFYKRGISKDGLQSRCKSCDVERYRKWVNKNRLHHNETKRIYHKERLANDINFRLANNLRNRFRKALLRQLTYKNDKTEDLLGISYSEFKEYIEFLMKDDMGWDNIHLDHVRPLTTFDLKDIEQLKEAAHYSNIQPLLAKDNLTKGDRTHEHDIWSQSEKLYDYENYNYYSQVVND